MNALLEDTIRLVEPSDFKDTNASRYHAKSAWLLMRDRPLAYRVSDSLIKIEPAPVRKEILWLNKNFTLPYQDNSVKIWKEKNRLFIDFHAMQSQHARAKMFTHALNLCNWIYGHDYKNKFKISQDVIRTYTSIAAAMTLEFPQDRQFLTYTIEPSKTETFALYTPGVSESHYLLKSQTVVQRNTEIIKRIWTLQTQKLHDSKHDKTALNVVKLRNSLEQYSWKHTNYLPGLSAPVCWQYMDELL